MSCSETNKIPDRLTYEFTGSASLFKDGDYIALAVKPRWANAQLPPPETFDRTPRIVFISSDDFAALWNEMEKIDFKTLTDPQPDNFETMPPDINYSESLRLIINNDTLADWSRPQVKLHPPIRTPLDTLTALMGRTFETRTQDPHLPGHFLLRMEMNVDGTFIFRQLQKRGDTLTLDYSGQSRIIRPEQFKSFWINLLDSKILGREFGSVTPGQADSTRSGYCALRAIVENKVLQSWGYTGEFLGKVHFDRLWVELEKLVSN